MRKVTIPLLFLLVICMCSMTSDNPTKTLYEFQAKTLDGKDFDFTTLKGKKVLIVNVASECGYTYQYEGLQQLHEKYDSTGKLVIIGFPCNQFGKQEPGSSTEIQSFCQKNYGVTFQMMEKIDVKGKDQHPIYKWLTHKDENGVEDSEVKWNFNKYAIDENGKYVRHYGSGVEPMSDEIIKWIEGGIGDASDTTIYSSPDVKPEYPGGEAAQIAFLQKNIRYPQEAKEKNQQGTAYISFVVEKDGKLTHFEVYRGVKDAPSLDAEALSVVSQFPDYTPGKTGGNPVRTKMVVPVKFVLN